MDILGALIGVIPTVASGLFPNQTAIEQARSAAEIEKAKAAAAIEQDKINAKATEKYIMFGLIGVGVIITGLVAMKMVQD